MRKPVVSVLIPVYNVEKYLDRCLDSVQAQTLQNIEIVCVNDGSVDGSAKILEKHRKKDKRIKIITKNNGGLPSARNAGLDAARGEYVGFVDSDDYIEPDMFEKLVNAARIHDSEVVICGSNIFPEEPKAGRWLYESLSPAYRHYETYHPDIVYTCADTTPFLWRTLIRKSLIERYHFRLDEKVILGEDKLFQAKIYPYARGITVIPDKLYNYFWCRPDSIMSRITAKNLSKKLNRHVDLVIAMLNDMKENTDFGNDDAYQRFYEWAIPFLYDDFISLSQNDKRRNAAKLIPVFEENGILACTPFMEPWKQEQISYIRSFRDKEKNNIRLTVVIPVEYHSEYIEETIHFIHEMAETNVEFVFVNNGTRDETYLKLQKLMTGQKNVSIFNTERLYSYYECLNTGIELGAGEYITFLETKDRYISAGRLSEWLEYTAGQDYDVCCCKQRMIDLWTGLQYEEITSNQLRSDFNCHDFHEALYKRSFLWKKKLEFDDYAMMTGFDFWCRILSAKGRYACFEKSCYIARNTWKKDWIETKKIEKVLKCLERAAAMSVAERLPYLHARVFRILNGNEMRHLIVNGTRIYRMSPGECPNGENSQVNTITLLYSIVQKADPELLTAAGFREEESIADTLYGVIGERNKFLAEL